jgi:hypothetical protein
MRIYITHCSAKKDPSLKDSNSKVTPDKLYTAMPTQRFMKKCKDNMVTWAIFSDQFGVWFPEVEHEWYEKDPDSVTQAEFEELLHNFEHNLRTYESIMFYHNPGRFHPFYRRVVHETKLRDNVLLFTHLKDIH